VSLSADDALRAESDRRDREDSAAAGEEARWRTADAGGTKRKLQTADATLVTVEVDWRTRVLSVITNPSVAYLMILVGIYALVFEFMNPGVVLPGVVGRDLRAGCALCVPPAAGELRGPRA
jgi:membrane-bound serine protease (ClpP class)